MSFVLAPDTKVNGLPDEITMSDLSSYFGGGGAANITYSYHSTDTTNSLAHKQSSVGELLRSNFSDSNKISGSGASWEVLNNTGGTATDTLIVSGSDLIMQGTYHQFALREYFPNLSQMMVNTKDGTLQTGKIQKAGDYSRIADPSRRPIFGRGRVYVSQMINMQWAEFDFSALKLVEAAGGVNDILIQVGDPSKTLGLSEKAVAKINVEGINIGPGAGQYDFQGTHSQATGASIREADSQMSYEVYARRLKIGCLAWGNTEQNRMYLDARYCHIGLLEYGPATTPAVDSGTPDTVKWTFVGKLCKQWYLSGADTSTWVDFACHDRIDDGTTMPAAWDGAVLIPTPAIYISNGKRQILSGFMRGHNGRLLIYVDRATSTSKSGLGSDTVTLNELVTTHTYGTMLLVDRAGVVDGSGCFFKDVGNGRSNYAASDSISCAVVQINRVDKKFALPLSLEDIYADYGVAIGDTTKDLFPTDIVFSSPINVYMRNGAGTAFIINKAVRCSFPNLAVNTNISLGAACSECHLDLSVNFIRQGLQVVKHASATASVRFHGSLTAAQLPTSWAFVGMSVECVSDQGGKPAWYNGSAWVYPA